MNRMWVIALLGCGYPPLEAAPPGPDASSPDPDLGLFHTVAPVKISAGLSCTTDLANTARKIAVNADGTIYAVMKCGSAAMVAISRDRGESFSAPSDLSRDLPGTPVTVAQVAVAVGPPGVAYVGMMLSSEMVYLRATQDHGATWSAAQLVGTGDKDGPGLALQAVEDSVYVAYSASGGASVARNRHRGDGAFDVTAAVMNAMYFDLLYDATRGSLVVTGDDPYLRIRASSDGGVSFGTEVTPPSSQYHSDWALGGGKIFVVGTRQGSAGTPTQICIIPIESTSTVSLVSGLPNVSTAQARSIAANTAGDAFVASQIDDGSIQLDRLAAAGTSFDAPRSLGSAGTSPIVASLPGDQGAAVVFTTGTTVWATVQIP